jgi:hypothetical protein
MGKPAGFLFCLSALGAAVCVSPPGTGKTPKGALGFIRFAGLHPNEPESPVLLLLLPNKDVRPKGKF